jgi:Cu/Ag efflux protein CusF
MKSTAKSFLVAAVVLAFSGLGVAAEKTDKPMEPAPSKVTKPKTTTATGEVKSVDAKAATLTVKVKDKDVDLSAQSKSAKSALGKVKVGDMVKVSYTEKDGKMTATSITPVKAPEKKSEPAMDKSKPMEKPATK